jgi:hypothetical protein
MATKKVSADEKFERQDFDLFGALEAIDRKEYAYWDNLTPEQQKKFIPYLLVMWTSSVKANKNIQNYYLRSIDHHANQHVFNENVQKHPKLQWMMLCAASPGVGKQYRQWIPQLSQRVVTLKEVPKLKDIVDYFRKIYPSVSDDELNELAVCFIDEHKKKCYIAKNYPSIKFEDIETLASIITQEEINEHEKESGF